MIWKNIDIYPEQGKGPFFPSSNDIHHYLPKPSRDRMKPESSYEKVGAVMKKVLKVGSAVGLVSGAAAIILYQVLCFWLDVSFEKMTPVSIIVMCVVVNVIGAYIYSKLAGETKRPRLYYGVITATVGILLSLYDWAYPAEPGIAGVANTIHALVATLSIAWIPIWMRKANSSGK
jgi:hypothetical protein